MQITIEKKHTSTEVIEVKINSYYKHNLLSKFSFISKDGVLIEIHSGYMMIWHPGTAQYASIVADILSSGNLCTREEFEEKYNELITSLSNLVNWPADNPAEQAIEETDYEEAQAIEKGQGAFAD